MIIPEAFQPESRETLNEAFFACKFICVICMGAFIIRGQTMWTNALLRWIMFMYYYFYDRQAAAGKHC